MPRAKAPNLSHIITGLRPLAVAMSTLTPDPKNARSHGEENIEAIKASLSQFGQDQPLVVQAKTGVICKGNGRFQAARELGWTHIAAVMVSEDNMEAAARAIADNRTAELAKWDVRVLSVMLGEIQLAKPDLPPAAMGFTQDQIERIHAKFNEAPKGEASPLPPPTNLVTPEDVAPVAHVRMKQLYLNTETGPEFDMMVGVLGARYGLSEASDVVMQALRVEYTKTLIPDDEPQEEPSDNGQSEEA